MRDVHNIRIVTYPGVKRIVFSILILMVLSSWSMIVIGLNAHQKDGIANDPTIDSRTSVHDLQNYHRHYFTENLGQWNDDIHLITNTAFGQVGLGRGAVYYNILSGSNDVGVKTRSLEKKNCVESPDFTRQIVRLSFAGAEKAEPVGIEPLCHRNNYFIGNDSSNWITGVKNYRKVMTPLSVSGA